MLVWGHRVHQLTEAGVNCLGSVQDQASQIASMERGGVLRPYLYHKGAYWQLMTSEEGHYPLGMWLFVRCLCPSGWPYTNVHMGRLNDLRFNNSGGKGIK